MQRINDEPEYPLGKEFDKIRDGLAKVSRDDYAEAIAEAEKALDAALSTSKDGAEGRLGPMQSDESVDFFMRAFSLSEDEAKSLDGGFRNRG
ncbi:MAG: hypothetical protein VR70_10690 [Rhodospirillaceae bacterium BRH_c57]|nr:MAG: hypothetical protein VR70_10690 [Rhodospirillaceae bacterium BRH_c57]